MRWGWRLTLCFWSSLGATAHLSVPLPSAASGGPHHAVRAEAAEDADGADHLPVQVCLPGPHPVPQELSSDLKSTVEARQMKRTVVLFFGTTDQTLLTACWRWSRRRIGAIFQITLNQCVQISICNSLTILCAVCVLFCVRLFEHTGFVFYFFLSFLIFSPHFLAL